MSVGTVGMPPPPPPPPPGPTSGSRFRALLISGTALVAVGALVAVITLVVSDRDDAAAPVPDGFDRAPSVLWTADASGVVPAGGREMVFASPSYMSLQYGSVGAFVLGDVAVTTVFDFDDRISEATVAAMELATGETRWTTTIPSLRSCARGELDGSLVCVRTDDDESTIMALDLDTGEIGSETTVDYFVGSTEIADGSLYVSGYQSESSGDGRQRISRGTVDEPERNWTQSFEFEQCEGGGDYDSLDVHDGVVAWWAGGRAWRADDGTELASGRGVSLVGNGVIEVPPCRSGSNANAETEFVDSDATVVRSAPVWSVIGLDTPGVRADLPLVLSDGTAVNRDGSRRWFQPSLADRSSDAGVSGDVIVQFDGDDHVFGVSVTSGDILWRSDIALRSETGTGSFAAVEGDRILVLSGDALASLSTVTGDVEWTLDLPLSDDYSTVTAASDGMVLVETSDYIVALGPDAAAADDRKGS